jgi:deoxyribonuclease IV
MRFGRHMPTGSRPAQALRTARQIGGDAAQVFVTNPRAWRASAPNPTQEAAFRAAATESDIAPVVVHAAYLINLASPKDDFYAASVELLRATLDRAARHGASSVVFHIGSHTGSGEPAGIARLTDGLRRVLEGAPESVTLLLENDTGGGGKVGYAFENLAAVLDQLPEHRHHLGVCLDTAHLWGAGFDIGTPEGAARTLADADRVIGLDRVPVIHLNDTPEGLGSHRDHHARIGEGIIPAEGLAAFLHHPGLAGATIILETPIKETAPGTPDWDHERTHMARARALAGLPMPAEPPTDTASLPLAPREEGTAE